MTSKHLKSTGEEEKLGVHGHDGEDEYEWINDMLMTDDPGPISLNEILGSSSADSNFGFNSNDQDFFSILDNIKEEDLFGSMDEEDDRFRSGIMKKEAAEGIRGGGLDQQCGNSLSTFNSGFINSNSRDISDASIRKSSNYVNNYGYTNITSSARQEGTVVVPSAPHSHPRKPGNWHWVPVGPDILPRAELCLASVKDYLLGPARTRVKEIDHNSTTTKVRMHLSYLGWKIECARRDGATSNSIIKFRYTSPDDKAFYSLADVCRKIELGTTSSSQKSVTDTKKLVTVASKDGVCKFSGGESMGIAVRNNMKPANAHIKPKYCPQAIIAWVDFRCASDRSRSEELKRSGGSARCMALQAKEHLRAVGWDFFYYTKPGNKQELRYRSPFPPNPTFSSLVTACKRCMKDSKLSERSIGTNGFVSNEKQTPNGCKEVKGFKPRCAEGFASAEKNSEGLSNGFGRNKTSFTVSPRIDSNPLPVDWQLLKGYYTEPLDPLDLEELNEEYQSDFKQMVNK